MSTKKSSSKKQLQSKNITKQTKTIKMQSQRNKYYIIENQFLDISLLKNKEVPNDYINFLKKCYKINNTIFPYDIIDNKLPQHLDVSLLLLNYICSNGKLYLKDYKGRKEHRVSHCFRCCYSNKNAIPNKRNNT